MPSRVVRGEINESASLSRVSIGADLMFRALIVAVDDYGRLDARPEVLKARLFPVRETTLEQIGEWLHELSYADGEQGPVITYQVKERPYLQLRNWESHRGRSQRAKDSRYPAPLSADLPGIRESPGDPGISRGSGNLQDPRESPENPPGFKESGVGGREGESEGERTTRPPGSTATPAPKKQNLVPATPEGLASILEDEDFWRTLASKLPGQDTHGRPWTSTLAYAWAWSVIDKIKATTNGKGLPKYKSLKLTLINWAPRAKPHELEEADWQWNTGTLHQRSADIRERLKGNAAGG